MERMHPTVLFCVLRPALVDLGRTVESLSKSKIVLAADDQTRAVAAHEGCAAQLVQSTVKNLVPFTTASWGLECELKLYYRTCCESQHLEESWMQNSSNEKQR